MTTLHIDYWNEIQIVFWLLTDTKQNIVCPSSFACPITCLHGYKPDANGCPTCSCHVVPGICLVIHTCLKQIQIKIRKNTEDFFLSFIICRTGIHFTRLPKMQWSLLLLREMPNCLHYRKWRLSTMRLRAGCVFDHAHLESEMDGTSMKMLCVYNACLLCYAIVKQTEFSFLLSSPRIPLTHKIHIYLHFV